MNHEARWEEELYCKTRPRAASSYLYTWVMNHKLKFEVGSAIYDLASPNNLVSAETAQ